MHQFLQCLVQYIFLAFLTNFTLFMSSYQGYVSAALVLGGVDVTGPHLHTVSLTNVYDCFLQLF